MSHTTNPDTPTPPRFADDDIDHALPGAKLEPRSMRNIHRARELRLRCTEAEHALWQRVRARRLAGLKFRRQHPVGDFFVDFYCAESGLVVEVDGSQHFNSPSDVSRTRALERRGLRVLRFWNDDVLLRMQDVLDAIVAVARRGGGVNSIPG